MSRLILFVLGLLLGLVGAGLLLVGFAADLGIRETASPVGLEETVTRIQAAAVKEGWIVKSVMALDESVRKNGGGEVLPVRVMNICEAKHAGRILREDDARKVSVMMPCRISVYTKSDGKTYIASMNAALVARLFPGVVSNVMGGPVAEAQQRFVDAATAPLDADASKGE